MASVDERVNDFLNRMSQAIEVRFPGVNVSWRWHDDPRELILTVRRGYHDYNRSFLWDEFAQAKFDMFEMYSRVVIKSIEGTALDVAQTQDKV